jgi:ribosomal RNA-processing protein 9
VNGIEFSKNGDYLVAAIGQENRMGRWTPIKTARNGLLIYRFK